MDNLISLPSFMFLRNVSTKKLILHGKCFVRYLPTLCFCIRNLTRSLRSLVRILIRQQLLCKYTVRQHFPWSILYISTTWNGSIESLSCFSAQGYNIGMTTALSLILAVSMMANCFIVMIVYKTPALRKPMMDKLLLWIETFFDTWRKFRKLESYFSLSCYQMESRTSLVELHASQ